MARLCKVEIWEFYLASRICVRFEGSLWMRINLYIAHLLLVYILGVRAGNQEAFVAVDMSFGLDTSDR